MENNSPFGSFVGQGLAERTPEECLRLGLNPNPDEGGSLNPDLDDREKMREHIRSEKNLAIGALLMPD